MGVCACMCPSRKLGSWVPSCAVGGEAERSRLNPSHLSPFLLCCELLSFTAMKTIVGFLAKPWLPQHHKTCAKEKGEARGCFGCPDTHLSENTET